MSIGRWAGAAFLALAAAAAGRVEAGQILSPVAVPVNTGGSSGPDYEITNTINQSGLSSGFVSGVTDFDTYIGTNPTHTSIAAGNEWFTPLGVRSSTIVYDLGAAYDISRIALWDEESAGIETMTVSTSDDLSFSTFNAVGTFSPANSPLFSDYPAQVFGLVASTARYVRLEVTGPQPDSFSDTVSMGEIAFDTLRTAVPEPSSLVTLGLGIAGLGLARRRRKAEAAA